MGNIMWGIVFLLAGVVLVWLGIRQRKRAQRDYEDDVRRYTASTVMTVVHLDESVLETWEDRDDGGRELRRETVYQPTYEYTVDGKTYRYASRQCVSSRDMGRQVTGYYDPADPSCITENRPRKPILGGFFFFAFAAFLLFFANAITADNSGVVAHCFEVIVKICKELGVESYRIVNNCGDQAGQTVKHLHFHVLAGRDMTWPPG